MSRRGRLLLLGIGLAGLVALLAVAVAGLPSFGTETHPYGDRAVSTALERQTANVIASINFDQRALDTLGEEFILFAAVLGAALLLRPEPGEREDPVQADEPDEEAGRRLPPQLDLVRLSGYLLLPVTVLVGGYVVAHGQLTPGGGFQGGVVLASALHLVYLSGDYRALRRLRPVAGFEVAEAVGAGAYLAVGLAGLVAGGALLANVLPLGSLRSLGSAGTVVPLNAAVGLEVAAGLVLLLGEFFDQAFVVTTAGPGGPPGPTR